jgi:alginate O-acetyltransferase complex protein AlgI
VLWGLMNGVGLVAVRLWARAGIRFPSLVAWAITFLFVNLAWVLFRAPDVATASGFYATLFGARGFGVAHAGVPTYTLGTLAIAATIAMLPRNSNRIVSEMSFGWAMQAATALLLAAGILSLANPTEFLYFNF